MLLHAEKNDEVLVKNGSQRPVGAQPLPEVHLNIANRQMFNGTIRGKHSNLEHRRKLNRNRRSTNPSKGKGTTKPRFDKSKLCNKCGCYTHSAEKCIMPKHLVMLYQQSQGHKAHQGKRFEANFNLHLHNANGAGGSHDVPLGPSNP